jgi:hypothetical protein
VKLLQAGQSWAFRRGRARFFVSGSKKRPSLESANSFTGRLALQALKALVPTRATTCLLRTATLLMPTGSRGRRM